MTDTEESPDWQFFSHHFLHTHKLPRKFGYNNSNPH